MQTTITMLAVISAILVLALLALAVYTRRAAEDSHAAGYCEGRKASKQRIHDLNHTIEHQRHQAAAERAEHRQELEAIMQDCDARIAIYAARALTPQDIHTLRLGIKQLALATQTYTNLKLGDQARFASTVAQHITQLAARIESALAEPAAAQPHDILDIAANISPNGKSWLVHGPEGCGKSRNARAIADALGLPDILDDWQPGMPWPTTKTLVLTNHSLPADAGVRVLTFEQAMALVASKTKQEAAA